jgi:hypothetical protein
MGEGRRACHNFQGQKATMLASRNCPHAQLPVPLLRGAKNRLHAQAASTATSEQIEEYLVQLAALAESSLAGALQCTYGKIQCGLLTYIALIIVTDCILL